MKIHHLNDNGEDLKLTWKIFIIRRNVAILLTMRVILNLVERNQLKPLDMPISVSNFITGMVTDKSCR